MIKLGHEVEFDGRMWVVTEFCEEPNTGLAVLTPQPAFLSESTYALPKARTVPVALLDLLEAWKRSDGIHAGRADEYKARVTALEEEVRDAEAKHQKAFEDGLEIVRKANARIAALESESAQYRGAAEKAEKECERLREESKRWRAMFEHAAQLIADEIDAYGLAGDEATEEIERWAARAAGEG